MRRLPRPGSRGVALAALLLALYLASYSGAIHATDEQSMFAAAQSLLTWGQATTNQVLWENALEGASNTFGPDGNLYSKKGPATSVLLLPMLALARNIPGVGLFHAALLVSALVTAGTAWAVWACAGRLGFAPGPSLAAGLAYGAGTMAWPYARYLYSEPVAGLFLALALLLLLPRATGPRCLSAGLALGAAVAARYANLALAPLWLAYVWWVSRAGYRVTADACRVAGDGRASAGVSHSPFNWSPPSGRERVISRHLTLPTLFTAGVCVVLALLGAYNVWRFGGPLDTGYAPEERFSTPLWQGVAGMLVSPGRSLFVYSPLLLLALYGQRWLWRRRPAEAALGVGLLAAHLALYGAWYQWWGGLTWGPRFLLPALPIVSLGFAPVAERLGKGRRLAAAAVALAALGLMVNLLGVATSFTEAPSPDDSLSPVVWNAARSPLLGHLALLHRAAFDIGWLRTQGGPDLPALLAAVSALLLAGLALGWALGGRRGAGGLAALALLGWAGAALFSLERFDGRLGANLGLAHSDLLPTLAREGRSGDAVVLNLPLHQEWLLNANRLSLPSYGYAKDTLERVPRSAPLLEQVVASHRRIWLPVEWSPIGDRTSHVEAWLAARAFPLEMRWFGDEARLILFLTHPGPPRVLAPPPIFGGALRLAAASAWLRSAGPGPPVLLVALRWQRAGRLPAPAGDLRRFVHVTGGGRVIAQADGVPQAGFRPVETWADSETVADNYALPLPVPSPPDLHVTVGLYHGRSGARLRLENGAEEVEVVAE